MQPDNEINWDPSQLPPALSPIQKVYVLFLLVAVCAAIVKTVALWIPAPPFRLLRQANNPRYIRELRVARDSIKQWLGCVVLGGGVAATTGLTDVCNRLFRSKAMGNTVLLVAIRDFSVQLSATFVVGLFTLLAAMVCTAQTGTPEEVNASRKTCIF